MEWPSVVTIVDDIRHAKLVAVLLDDVTWINKPPEYFLNEVAPGALGKENLRKDDIQHLLSEVRGAVKELAESQPDYFRNKTEFILIRSENDVENALQRLHLEGPAIAFIDFNYSKASKAAHVRLREEYDQLHDEWRLAGDEEEVYGGCVFSAAFGPSRQSPPRVLCPTTNFPPFRLRFCENESITEHCGLHDKLAGALPAVLLALNGWVALQHECPLDEIWRRTARWFVGEGEISDGHMPHTLPTDSVSRHTHYEIVKRVLNLEDLQEDWWDTADSATELHEALKHLCGGYYCGSSNAEKKYNLSVGAAFLIALLALRDTNTRNRRDLINSVKNLEDLRKLRCPILPLQKSETARGTARALYFLFFHLFREDRKYPKSRVSKLEIRDGGRKLRIKLEGWDAEKIAADLTNLPQAEAEKLYPQKILPCIHRVQKFAAISSEGFGGPGTFRLLKGRDDKVAEFWISSTESE